MMVRNPRSQSTVGSLFGLNDESVKYRQVARGFFGFVVWFALSSFTLLLTLYTIGESPYRFTLLILSFIKYIPILAVTYFFARRMAAHYLDDIYELHDEKLAGDFIEDVAFGFGHEHITIDEGRISQDDEKSAIILVGGPGRIQVNLDSVALLEKLDGEPEVISPRSEPWVLGRFERIREIGTNDEVGKREYAIINLRDQFITDLRVTSRTKDGIPIEANDIKVLFSILRRERSTDVQDQDYLFDEHAVHDLVYNQTLITPPPPTQGVGFPWDTTVIPLVITELENLITSRNLSEILASISQKEIDRATEFDETIAQMRVEITGQQSVANASAKPNEAAAPNFESRTRITSIFFTREFKEKAAKIGVQIEWIDIGNWQLPYGIILENLKEAWNLIRENAKKRGSIEKSRKRLETDEFLQLINNVIFANYDKKASGINLTDKEFEELIKDNPEVIFTPALKRRLAQMQSSGKPDVNTVAQEMLKAFRKELFAIKTEMERDARSPLENREEIAKLDKALRDIAHLTSHFV
jgi:hypothetical protein